MADTYQAAARQGSDRARPDPDLGSSFRGRCGGRKGPAEGPAYNRLKRCGRGRDASPASPRWP